MHVAARPEECYGILVATRGQPARHAVAHAVDGLDLALESRAQQVGRRGVGERAILREGAVVVRRRRRVGVLVVFSISNGQGVT